MECFTNGFHDFKLIATWLDYAIDKIWTVAAEEYDDCGSLLQIPPGSQQIHRLWGVADYVGDPISIENGNGDDLTPGADFSVGFMLMTDLTGEYGLFHK
jgi:hypothetical protein